MQCELCSESGSVSITEIVRGKVSERHLCRRHATEQLGGPAPDEWAAFIHQIVVRLEERGSFPTVTEISQLGEIGNRMAKWSQRPHTRIMEFLQAEAQKHLASS